MKQGVAGNRNPFFFSPTNTLGTFAGTRLYRTGHQTCRSEQDKAPRGQRAVERSELRGARFEEDKTDTRVLRATNRKLAFDGYIVTDGAADTELTTRPGGRAPSITPSPGTVPIRCRRLATRRSRTSSRRAAPRRSRTTCRAARNFRWAYAPTSGEGGATAGASTRGPQPPCTPRSILRLRGWRRSRVCPSRRSP